MAETTSSTIKTLKPGQYILIEGEVCKVAKIDVSKSGKHGAAKARMEAIGLIDGKRHSVVKPADSDIEVPIILKKVAQVIAFVGEQVQLMDLQDYSTFESPIPEELKGKLQQGGEVLYWQIGEKKILREARG